MEVVQGEPITAYCDRHKFTIRERLELFVPICQAIQHAHQKGIIHRDIKPSNVLVMIRDDHPVPKIIDFGVAKAMAQPLTERTLFTEQGQMIGTPAYMSPEQAEMTGLDIDTRSDVYSLGVMLYELLTGILPFDQETLRAAGFAEIARIIRDEDPPKPSTKISTLDDESETFAKNRRIDVAALRRQLRGELDWIIMKTLEKDRTRRYATALDLGEDIERYMKHEPVEAGPPGAIYRLRKVARKYRLPLAIGAAIALVLVVGVVASTFFAIQSHLNARRAQSALGQVREEKDRADVERDRALAQEGKTQEQAELAKAAQQRAEAAQQRAEAAQEHAERQNYYTTIRLATAKLDGGHYGGIPEMLRECPKPLRAWEWGYLMARCPKEDWKLEAHEGSVSALAVSPSGTSFVSAGADGTLILWELEPPPGSNGSLESTLSAIGSSVLRAAAGTAPDRQESGQDIWMSPQTVKPKWTLLTPGPVDSVTFFPDGKKLAAHEWKRFFVCDAETGALLHDSGNIGATCFCLSSDGKLLYAGTEKAGDEPAKIQVYSTIDWTVVRSCETDCPLFALSVGADGRYLVGVGYGKDPDPGDHFRVYEAEELTPVWTESTQRFPRHVAVDSRTNSFIYSAWAGVNVCSIAETKQLFRFYHNQPVTSVAVDSANGLFASAGQGGTARVKRIEDGKAIRTIEQGTGITAVTFLPTSGVLTGDRYGTVRCWNSMNPTESQVARRASTGMAAGTRVSFRSDGKMLAVQGWSEDHLVLWDTETWSSKKHELPDVGVYFCRFRPGTNQLALSTDDSIRVFDTSERGLKLVNRIETRCLADSGCFDRSGKLLAVSYLKRPGCDLFDLGTGRSLPIDTDMSGPCMVAISADGHTFGALGWGPTLHIWNVEDGRLIHEINFPHDPCAPAIAFHPDGEVLATTGNDGGIVLWDSALGVRLRELKGHAAGVCSLRFSPDGKRLLSGSHDQSIRVWDWQLGKELLRFAHNDYPSLDISFSPDGLSVAHTDAGPDAWVRRALPWDKDEHVRTFAGPALASHTEQISFEFNESFAGCSKLHDVSSVLVHDGALTGKITGKDPYLVLRMVRAKGDECPVIRLRMRVPGGQQGHLYWTTASSPHFGEDKKVSFAITADGEFHEYYLELGSHPLWSGQTITSVRVNPTYGADSGEFAIDYLRGAAYATEINLEFDEAFPNCSEMNDVASVVLKDGSLVSEITGPDPYLVFRMIRVAADTSPVVRLRMRVSGGQDGAIHWTTASSPVSNEEKEVSFVIVPDGEFHEYYLELGSHPLWSGQTITSIRVNPSRGTDAGEFAIDYLRTAEKPLLKEGNSKAEWINSLGFMGGERKLGPGKVGSGLWCDGRSYFFVPHAPVLEPEHLTLEAWIHVSCWPSSPLENTGARAWIVNKNGNSWTDGYYGLAIAHGRVDAYLNVGGGKENCYQVFSSEGVLKLDRWHHVAMTYDGSELKVYLDGTLVASTQVNKKRVPGTMPLNIGRRSDAWWLGYFQGRIDEVRIYDRALSADEIKTHFREPGVSPPQRSGQTTEKGLIRCWSFDELPEAP